MIKLSFTLNLPVILILGLHSQIVGLGLLLSGHRVALEGYPCLLFNAQIHGFGNLLVYLPHCRLRSLTLLGYVQIQNIGQQQRIHCYLTAFQNVVRLIFYQI